MKYKHNPVHSIFLFSIFTALTFFGFNDDIVKSITNLSLTFKAELSQLYEQYHTTLKILLDKHASVRSKSIKIKPPTPWMSPEFINAKMRRRYLGGNHAHNRSRYTKQRHFCNRLVNKAKSDFYRNMISNNSDNPRQLWNYINRTLHRNGFCFSPRSWLN